VAVTVEVPVDSINGLTESGAISKEFIGVILLPIVVATAHCGENLYDLYEHHASDTNSAQWNTLLQLERLSRIGYI